MNQQDWVKQYLGQEQLGQFGQSQIMGMQNMLGPKTHEERVEYSLREMSNELENIKEELRSEASSNRFGFYVMVLHIATTAMILFYLLKK